MKTKPPKPNGEQCYPAMPEGKNESVYLFCPPCSETLGEVVYYYDHYGMMHELLQARTAMGSFVAIVEQTLSDVTCSSCRPGSECDACTAISRVLAAAQSLRDLSEDEDQVRA